jgi:hypothetical protein
MDGTRLRRTLDPARQGWYSRWRSVRFARYLGFTSPSLPGSRSLPGERRATGASNSQVG